MESRRAFVLGAGAGLFLPRAAAAAPDKDPKATAAKLVRAADPKPVWAMGVLVTVRADAKLTGGGYSVFEDLIPPGGGPPLHTHTREDETLYVLEGELTVFLGDDKAVAKPGDFAHMARGTPHRFVNHTAKPVRTLMTYSPGGFEQWFADIGTPAADPAAPPPKATAEEVRKAVAAAEKYGVTFAKK
jgi:quercetin dioxygenase-like cupin family protein